MAAFIDIDWRRIDVCAIVASGGLATVEDRRHPACRKWLLRNGYQIDTFDCRPGLAVAIPELGRTLCWEQQFGYSLRSDNRNLDALRDGFEFDALEGGGRVFEIIGADRAAQEDSRLVLRATFHRQRAKSLATRAWPQIFCASGS